MIGLLSVGALNHAIAKAQEPLEQLTISQLEERIEAGELGDPVDIKSAGKSITALAVGAAIADGKLAGTGIKVWPFLGLSRGEPFDNITVCDLLSMSSALDCNGWERRSPGQEEKMYRRRKWRTFALGLPARDYERNESGQGPFSYCTAGVFLLGQVVEKATGDTFDAYVQRRLFDPLGIPGAEWRRSRSGEVQSGGQLTIDDHALIKLGQLVLKRGQWDGQEIIPENWLRTMLTPSHTLGQHVHYGYLWWMMPVQSSRGFEAAFMKSLQTPVPVPALLQSNDFLISIAPAIKLHQLHQHFATIRQSVRFEQGLL